EVPPEGITVTFACEVLNPAGEWERSPDYKMQVVRREKPMDVYIGPSHEYGYAGSYGPDNSFEFVTVIAGGLYERFGFITKPCPAEDMQLQYGLKGPNGYSGGLGELIVEPIEIIRNEVWICYYTAPEGISSPVDIIAWFSIYDPWIKQKRELELTFHVVPKELTE
ncbi:MAG: hypothetical protein LBQ86_09255, partial [Holophagales bacterium]|nr:hypothetical protein [Holophagales bacterium]